MGAIEIWRGGVNTWECDEMGHMNVRFYVARFMDGVAGMAMRLGLPRAFSPDATATLIVEDHHLRFQREAQAGAPLVMTGGVVTLTETGAVVLQILTHAVSGEPCATAITRVTHTTALGRPFPWPSRTAAAAGGLMVEVPPFAAPRSIDSGPIEPAASLDAADRLHLGCAARGAITAADCDAFGRMRPEVFLGRVSEGVPGLLAPVRKAVAAGAPDGVKRIGGAVLEYRLIYLDWPHAGDHVELRSGLRAFDDKTQRITHWLLDPVSGRPWAVSEAVAINLDLDARKIVPISAEAQKALKAFVSEGLTL
jgi:acyl-CoA thioester hydrolase